MKHMKTFEENICKKNNCIKCCYNTEMILLEDDIKKILKIGFDKEYFMFLSKGYKSLKNKNKRCVFHDGVKCTIYESRPKGCQLYPIVFNQVLKRPVFDVFCPYWKEFNLTNELIQRSYETYERLMSEKEKPK